MRYVLGSIYDDTFALLIELVTSCKGCICSTENIGAFENCSESDHHKTLAAASWEKGEVSIKVYFLLLTWNTFQN